MAKYRVAISGLNGSEVKNLIEQFFYLQPRIFAKAHIGRQQVVFKYSRKLWSPEKIDKYLANLGFDKLEHVTARRMEPHMLVALVTIILSLPLLMLALPVMRPDNVIAVVISFVLATFLQFGVGGYFYIKVFQSLFKKKLRSSLPLMLATSLTYAYSVTNIVLWAQDVIRVGDRYNEYFLFYINALMFLIFTIAKAIEHSIVSHNEDYRRAVSHFKINRLRKIVDGVVMECEATEVVKGDIVRVEANELVPLEGKIVSGFSYFDESMHSGDTRAIYHGMEETVRAGSLNKTNTVDIVVAREWNEGLLAQFDQEVEGAIKEIEIEAGLNKIYQITLLLALVGTVASCLLHYFVFDKSWADSFAIALSVLIISTPASLTLAKPISTMMGSGKLDVSGMKIKNFAAIEEIAKADAIVFSHVGTLTSGRPSIQMYQSAGKKYDDILYTLEKKSIFPLAQIIASYLETLNAKHIKMETASMDMGRIKALVDGEEYYFGSYASCLQMKKNVAELDDFYRQHHEESAIILFLISGEKVLIKMVVVDRLKEAASPAIRRIVMEDLTPYLISSEKQKDAEAAARKVGIPSQNVFAEVKPLDKLDVYQQIKKQNNYQHTIFVGDSLNDAPSVFGADISITINDGNRFALETGDIILKNDDLTAIARIIVFAKKIVATQKTNIVFGTAFPILLIPVACFGLLSPLLAIILSVSCQVLVAANAFRVKFWKLY